MSMTEPYKYQQEVWIQGLYRAVVIQDDGGPQIVCDVYEGLAAIDPIPRRLTYARDLVKPENIARRGAGLKPMDFDERRGRLIDRALKIRQEIDQIFTDVASYNQNSDGPLIEADPDGSLAEMRRYLDTLIPSSSESKK